MDQRDDQRVRGWVDKLELAELLAELSSAMDRGDEARIASCYAEESFDDHGSFTGSGRALAAFMGRADAMPVMHHLLGQSVFDVQGDEAWGETFFIFHGAVAATSVSGYGRYADYFRRIDGAWKVVYRRVVPDAVPDDITSYWRSRRDHDDPSYDRLRWPPDVPAPR